MSAMTIALLSVGSAAGILSWVISVELRLRLLHSGEDKT